MLAASAAALPALQAILAGRPPLSTDVITLQEVIAAERAMIALYQAAVNAGARPARGLAGLMAQHRQHLSRLQASLVLPPGSASASPSPSVSVPKWPAFPS